MSGPGRSWVRRNRAEVERLKRRLRREDGTFGHPYFRDLRKSAGGPGREISISELVRRCALAHVVYVGDFHADPACQRFASTLLSELAGAGGRVGLGVEFVYTRQQPDLDRRQNGELPDEEFLKRIHYRGEWGYEWNGYRQLLDRARDLDVPTYALDVSPRGGVRGLARRDEHAARRIEGILRAGAFSNFLVFFGESHVSPGRLPRRVSTRLRRQGSHLESVSVLQDPEAAYWWFLEERGEVPAAAELAGGCLAVFHTSPPERYERYRQVVERWHGDSGPGEDADLTPAVHHLIDGFARWIGVRADRRRIRHHTGWSEILRDAYPEVYSGADASRLLARILEEHGRSADEIREAESRFEERGALYEPRSNVFFLRRYLPGPAAGEAAKFLRAALCGRIFRGSEDSHPDPAERAYGQVLNEAIAYLGARLFDPASDLVTAPSTNGGSESDPESSFRREWLDRHRHFESAGEAEPPPALLEALRGSRSLRRALARDLGHRLGATLFARVRDGSLGIPALRGLFTRVLDPPKSRQVVLRILRAGKD